MQTSVDESKIFTLISQKVTHDPIFLLLELCNSKPHFLVISVIIAYHSVLTPYISKTHLPIHLMYVNSN